MLWGFFVSLPPVAEKFASEKYSLIFLPRTTPAQSAQGGQAFNLQSNSRAFLHSRHVEFPMEYCLQYPGSMFFISNSEGELILQGVSRI
jgi:hypothetical protein